MAPIAGWTATVDGTQTGLPDAPYNLFKKGMVAKSPKGDPITVVFGTNEDEMALFAIAIGLIIPHVKLPLYGGFCIALFYCFGKCCFLGVFRVGLVLFGALSSLLFVPPRLCCHSYHGT